MLAILAMAGMLPTALAESSLTAQKTRWISSTNNGGSKIFKVSVHPGDSGYWGIYDADGKEPGEISTEPFFDPIRAYRFWATTKEQKINTLAQSGKIIGDLQFTTNRKLIPGDLLQLWESTAPNGSAFSTTPDYSTATIVTDIDEASGSIEISRMASGSIIIIYGAYRSQPRIHVKMSGSGKAEEIDLGNIHSGDMSNNTEIYIAQVDFVNKDDYQSVDWKLPKGANYRFSGIVVTSSDPSR